MNPRMIHVAMLATAVVASGCVLQPAENTTEDVGVRTDKLLTGGDTSGGTKKIDPSGGDQTGGQGTPLPGDPDDPGDPGDKREGQGDPGKPSPDPWKPPSDPQPVQPGHVDPVVNSSVR
jgi:hypothetical protein